MSDPGSTYRTREEVQRMWSTQDANGGLQWYIGEGGLAKAGAQGDHRLPVSPLCSHA